MTWLSESVPPGTNVPDAEMRELGNQDLIYESAIEAAERRAGWDEAVGIDNNPEYCEIARRRIAADAPLFTVVLPLEPAAPPAEQLELPA